MKSVLCGILGYFFCATSGSEFSTCCQWCRKPLGHNQTLHTGNIPGQENGGIIFWLVQRRYLGDHESVAFVYIPF